jgi:hypothetical protein
MIAPTAIARPHAILADMNPKFLRFPGGNYLEGNTIKTRFNWKKPSATSRNVPATKDRMGILVHGRPRPAGIS